MYLSKLDLYGFKSFANKTSLKLNDGISCVIGPNGSGKSNIVDAIRWVLGEQKVSTLRSDKMENVIFNGTTSRKPLNYTEVSITIENNKNILDTTFSEVVVSRRLYRSGESNYFINKAPCRLKDITDLFMDTGIGADSYSVIELKMIEDIISDNPAERRHLFEEAAGVTKYKLRRKSTLRKLDATRQDMERISDLISEIKRTVNSLSRQVGKARRYLRYKEDLKKLDIDLGRYRFTRLMDEIRPLQQKLEEVKLIKEDTSHQITLEETLLEEYKRELLDIEQKLNEKNEKQRTYERKIHEIKEEEAIAKTRLESLMATRDRYKQEIIELKAKQQKLSDHFQNTGSKVDAMKGDLEQYKQAYHSKDTIYQDFFTQLKEEKKELEIHNQVYNDHLRQLNATNERQQQISFQLEWNRQQEHIHTEELNQLIESSEKTKKEMIEFERQKKTIEIKIKNLALEITENQKKYADTEKDIRQTTATFNQIQNDIKIVASRIHFFEQVITKYEGYPKSTQALMQLHDQFPGLIAPLSELIQVDAKYQVAMERALGEAVHYIIVENVSLAKEILKHVYDTKIGRITLLPLDRVNNIGIPVRQKSIPATPLSKLVSCEEKYQKIFELLLGDTFLVDDMNQALDIAKKHQRLRLVSLKGEMIDETQAITGGDQIDPKNLLIGRKEQLKQLRSEYHQLQQKEKQTARQLEKFEHEKTNLEQINEPLLDQQTTLKHSLDDLEKEEAGCRYIIQHADAAIIKNRQELGVIGKTLSNLEQEQISISEESSKHESTLKKLEIENRDRITAYEKREEELHALNSETQEYRVKYLNAQNTFDNMKADLERTSSTISETKNQILKHTEEIDLIAQQETEINNESKERTINQQSIWTDRDALDDETEQIQGSYHQIKDEIHQLEDQVKRFRKQHDSSLEHTKHLELQIQENKMKANAVMERIKNEYGHDITTGIAYDGINEEKTENEIETIKNKISQLGQVNPLAVSEYEKESDRLNFYTKQYDDLIEAEKSLQKTIHKINTTARKQFLDIMEKIEENFKVVFNRFFENGEGTLQLEENIDPLEANIEIMVRPKGKRMQTISLLSGGEKALTAISLLFSIYLVKPSPFCILDEVDAPLDDININRFTQALQEFSDNTQFIVVTHNKRTMESAHTLYGVTMEEEGLSKLVSVKFN